MESIKITTGSTSHVTDKRSPVSIDELRPLVAEFIHFLEIENLFNEELYNQIIALDINKSMFNKMLNDFNLYKEFDDVPDEVGFDYEKWLPQILLMDDNFIH